MRRGWYLGHWLHRSQTQILAEAELFGASIKTVCSVDSAAVSRETEGKYSNISEFQFPPLEHSSRIVIAGNYTYHRGSEEVRVRNSARC